MTIGSDALTMEGFGMHFNDTHMEMLLDGDSDYWADQLDKIKARIGQWKEEEQQRIDKKAKDKADGDRVHRRLGQIEKGWYNGIICSPDWDNNSPLFTKQELIDLSDEEFNTRRDAHNQEVKRRAALEVRKTERISELANLGLRQIQKNVWEGFECSVSILEIEELEEQAWRETVASIGQSALAFTAKKQKEEAEQATGVERIRTLKSFGADPVGTALYWGQMLESDWEKTLLSTRNAWQQREDQKAQQLKEQQLAEASDKEKYQEWIKYLRGGPKLEFKSGPYRAKAREINEFLDNLK